MLFKALVCDYDGTLASQDRIGPEALAAFAAARDSRVRVILAIGRTFFDLTRVCERLDLFDAVVAENGAVIYFPGTGAIHDQAPPPPARLLAELDRRGIYYQVGRVIVGTARTDEERVCQAAQIRKTEARWSRGDIVDLRRAIQHLIAARYGVDEPRR